MKFNQVIGNPPYFIGNKITTEAKKHANKTVCLMPLSCYKNKSNELWRYVESMELADPKMFADATITDNLCICTLQKDTCDVFKFFEDMEMLTFSSKLVLFYKTNKTLPKRYSIQCKNNKPNFPSDYNRETDFIESIRLPNKNGGGSGYRVGNNVGYNWNMTVGTIETLPLGLCCIQFESFNAKKNFSTWAYGDDDRLSNKLIYGTNNANATDHCSIAIPQIDWGTISDTQLWKEGKYDEAVLDVMGLKWDGDVIVEGNKHK